MGEIHQRMLEIGSWITLIKEKLPVYCCQINQFLILLMHMIVDTILNWIQSKNFLLIPRSAKKNPFVLYFVVPTKNFEKFKWTIKSDDSSKEQKENLKVLVSEIKEERLQSVDCTH
jgi:hypothetical protein